MTHRKRSVGNSRTASAILLAERGNRQTGRRTRRDRIIQAMADAFVEMATADLIEEEHGRRSKAAVQRLVDISDVHEDARKAAKDLAASLERLNGMPVDDLYNLAADQEGDFARSRETPEDFGHYMAMEALESGVRWDDSAPSFPHRVAPMEFHAYIGDDFLVYAAQSGPSERLARNHQRGRTSARRGR